MASRLNTLRYGSLAEVQAIMDGDEPLPDHQLRALVFNLVDVIRVQQSAIDRIQDRLFDIAPEIS
jgi:hypothetical protein